MQIKNKIFYLGVSLLFTHELDAMLNHEWRVLPLTSWLPDAIGQMVFVLAHVPLFAILIALISSSDEAVRSKTQFIISVVLTLHGALHTMFIMHTKYEFVSFQSNFLIFGGALCGIIYLLLNRK